MKSFNTIIKPSLKLIFSAIVHVFSVLLTPFTRCHGWINLGAKVSRWAPIKSPFLPALCSLLTVFLHFNTAWVVEIPTGDLEHVSIKLK